MPRTRSNFLDKTNYSPILKNVLFYFFLALVTSSLMQVDDFIQQLFMPANEAKFELKFALSLFGFHLLLWLAGNRILALSIMAIFGLLQFTQLLHISYVGRPLDPTTISSIFSESKDIGSAIQDSWKTHLHLILAVVLPYSINATIFYKLLPKKINPWLSAFCYLGIFLILASKPYRATYRDLNMFLPGPTRPSLYNSLDTYSFFLIKGFPSLEEVMPKAKIPSPTVEKQPTNAQTVWLIIVDSLRTDHMGIFGYERANTPFLTQWQNRGLVAQKGVASAVATAASVPLMINTIYDPGNIKQIKNAETNLFKLAKEAGFQTNWISSQGSRVLNDLGANYIDQLVGEEDAPVLFEKQKDEGIFTYLNKINFENKQFIVILLKGVHSPYADNYAGAREHFAKWDDSNRLDRSVRDVNSYDNSVLFADSILNKLLTKIYDLPGENHVVITSDHGQLLGEDNLWGHNILRTEIATIPVLSASWNVQESEKLSAQYNKPWISHFEISQWIATKLGTKISYPQYDPNVTFIQGKNLYGFNQYIEVQLEDEKSLKLSAPKVTSDYQPKLPPQSP